MKETARIRLLGFALVAVVASGIAVYRLHHDARRWYPDSAIYLRMTLQDCGLSRGEAREAADRFMNTTPARDDPNTKGFYSPNPPAFYDTQFDLFRTRPLYPALGALFYARFGPHGLQAVSAFAYVAATLLMFAILVSLVPAWLAALGALAFATAALVLDVSALATTDATALLFWVATLGGILLYQRRPSAAVLGSVAVAAFALSFTRPAMYLPIAAAAGAWVGARRRGTRTAAATRLLIATIAAAAVFVVYTVVVHGPGIVEQLRWLYAWRVAVGDPAAAHGFGNWYVRTVAADVLEVATYDVYKNGALLTLALAALGAFSGRRTREVPVLLAAACGTLVPLIVNPTDVVRPVLLPLTPIVIILATIALTSLASTLPGGTAGLRAGSSAIDTDHIEPAPSAAWGTSGTTRQ